MKAQFEKSEDAPQEVAHLGSRIDRPGQGSFAVVKTASVIPRVFAEYSGKGAY